MAGQRPQELFMATSKNSNREGLKPDPFWYKTGVIYELHVRAFCDSDGNGIGDFPGLTSKLDYLKDLGVTALWLLPFYPSPLRDDGYDIADYYSIHPSYGTLADFEVFLREAHQRGLRVITELVLNHTSDQHSWFQRARRSPPGSRWRDFYVWSDTSDRYRGARIIFKDLEISNWTWDRTAGAYYWHRFFSHQPDLNYDNPEVFEEMVRALDFWLDMGVDGMRLDAVAYLYEREGTSCENIPETHALLKKLRAHVDEKYGDRMLLAEANQWPEDAVSYFGQGRGDECHMAFHFPLMPRLFMALRMEDRTPIVDILEQTPPTPETAQWALFLRNHDELTLETVTDEERDYMYRMYAHIHQARLNLGIRRRLAPLLGNERRRIELLNALLFSLPGTPVLYYGDEIGMGDNIFLGDRNGVRTPMQWSSDKNAGFSRANPQALYLPIIYDPEYHYEAVNVEGQLGNPHSLLWWMRRLLALRKKWRALGEGRCEFLHPENQSILSYLLRDDEETLLVVANLSRFAQPVELDLSAFCGRVPVELFGRTDFPSITRKPYALTIGPHSFYWFSLESKVVPSTDEAPSGTARPAVTVAGEWRDVLAGNRWAALEPLLSDYIRRQRWFGGPAKTIKQMTIRERIPVPIEGGKTAFLTMVQVDYVHGDPELYSMPMAFAAGAEAALLRARPLDLAIADLHVEGGVEGVLYDALASPGFCQALLDMVAGRFACKGRQCTAAGSCTPLLGGLLEDGRILAPSLGEASQSSSCVLYGDKVVMKWFRRLDIGLHPEIEIGRFLAAREAPFVPPLAGTLECERPDNPSISLAILSGHIPNAKDAWTLAVDALGRYYDRAGALSAKGDAPPDLGDDWLATSTQEMMPPVRELIGTFLEYARMLGERTADLHRILASDTEDGRFAPEPFTPHYARSLFHSMRNTAVENLRMLRKRFPALPAEIFPMAEGVLALQNAIIDRYRRLFEGPIRAQRIRIHGDYHLGQVLWNGRDFMILGLGGDPSAAMSGRRIKRSPLRDLAGMIRSFDRAAHGGLLQQVERGSLPPENIAAFEPWARFWNQSVSASFLQGYLQTPGASEMLPAAPEDLQIMLRAYLLNQAMLELGQEMSRPSWLTIPLQSILHLAGADLSRSPG